MDAVPLITLAISVLSLFLGGGLLMQKRKEGEAWGTLVTKVDAVMTNTTQIGERLSASEMTIVQFRTALLGIEGRGGALEELKQLRAAKHAHGNEIHAHGGKLDIHEQRLDGHDQRFDDMAAG